MQPSSADHRTPEELAAYADGEAPAHVVAHVAECSACAERAAGYLQTARELRRSLYRFDCPTPLRLGEYNLDLLAAQERTSIAAHTTECDDCRAELQLLRAYLAAPLAMPESIGERVRRTVASLLKPSPGLAYGGLRGASDAATRVFTAGDVSVSVGPGPTRGSLIGLVVLNDAGEPSEGSLPREARLIGGQGELVAAALVDDLGYFEFGDLEAGVYVFELDLADRRVVIEELRLD